MKWFNRDWIKKNLKILIIGFVVTFGFAAVFVISFGINDDAMVLDVTQGMVYAKDVSLNTKIPGRIVTLFVEEGQEVKAGDPIVEISSEELVAKESQLSALVEQAKAGVEASEAVLEMANGNYTLAQARIEQATAGVNASKSQREMARAVNNKATNGARTQQVAQAESAYTLWESTYNRAVILYDGGAISLQKLEEIKTQMEVSEQTLAMAKEGAREEDKDAAFAQLSMAESGVVASEALLSQAIEGANIALAQVNQAQAGLLASQGKLEQAIAGLQEVQVYLKDTVIKAPMDGIVTTINSDEGELVSTGTSIGTVSNLDKCWVNVNLDEDKLNGLKEGQSVDVKLLAFEGQTFTGKVVTINKLPDFAIKKATNDNGNFDIISFGVKIELENYDETLRPGMTAIIDFNLGSEKDVDEKL